MFQYFHCFNCNVPFVYSICFISFICLDLCLIKCSYYSSCVNSVPITQCKHSVPLVDMTINILNKVAGVLFSDDGDIKIQS